MINIICPSRYKINRRLLKKNIVPLPNIDVNIIFVGKNKIRFLANKYKKDNIIHPVLSFYYKEENLVEIFICYPQAVLLAAERNKKLEETILYLIDHSFREIKI